jgi:hypothetical protein
MGIVFTNYFLGSVIARAVAHIFQPFFTSYHMKNVELICGNNINLWVRKTSRKKIINI